MSDGYHPLRRRADDRRVPPGGGVALALLSGLAGVVGAGAFWAAGAGWGPVLLCWLGLPPLVLTLGITVALRPRRRAARPRRLVESCDHG
ncbi:hypothetical protein [Pseudooceanicola sp. LIPI14-2-Ac024]|uniref:hypothetical protein n=1 Tax=Pseudooceanicola sp. LIPI14-2-Ac024 TaxID=3344875 RepID=UPI0035CECC35